MEVEWKMAAEEGMEGGSFARELCVFGALRGSDFVRALSVTRALSYTLLV